MISVSILNIKDNVNRIKELDKLNPDYIHIDIMDGLFVKNKVDMLDLPNIETKRDIHLMVYDVIKYIDLYKKYNPDYITFHIEAVDNISETINYIKRQGIKVGISIKPNTNIDILLPYLKDIDLVLVMSVEPGSGGQSFIENSTLKINKLKEIRDNNNYKYVIEVDGGINNLTKAKVKNADILVVGSYITLSDDLKVKLDMMK